MKQGSIWSWLSGDLPGEPLPGQSLLELTGDRQVLIENHRGVTQYSREQVAYLFFIAVAKNVLSLDALACFLRLQERTYPLEKAYNYFCRELENRTLSLMRDSSIIFRIRHN